MSWSALFLLSLSLAGQDVTVPPGASILRSVEGRGVQIYRCTRQADQMHWVFEAPEATLFESGSTVVGSHGAGPAWTWKDGSSIAGTIAQKAPAPDAGNIPWLLLSARPRPNAPGVLTSVRWVRRFDTQGGVAPQTGCDADHERALIRVPYSATYTFYTGAAQP